MTCHTPVARAAGVAPATERHGCGNPLGVKLAISEPNIHEARTTRHFEPSKGRRICYFIATEVRRAQYTAMHEYYAAAREQPRDNAQLAQWAAKYWAGTPISSHE